MSALSSGISNGLVNAPTTTRNSTMTPLNEGYAQGLDYLKKSIQALNKSTKGQQTALNRQYKNNQAAVNNSLINRGLGNSSILGTMQGGVTRNYNEALQNLHSGQNKDLSNLYQVVAQFLANQGQAQYNALNQQQQQANSSTAADKNALLTSLQNVVNKMNSGKATDFMSDANFAADEATNAANMANYYYQNMLEDSRRGMGSNVDPYSLYTNSNYDYSNLSNLAGAGADLDPLDPATYGIY